MTGSGIRVANEGSGVSTVLINNNTIREIGEFLVSGNFGVEVVETVAGGTTNATITGNTIDQVRDNRGMRASALVAGGTLCSDVSGNTFTNIDSNPQLRQAAGTHNNRQTNEANLEAVNGGQDFTITGAINFNGGVCTQPPP